MNDRYPLADVLAECRRYVELRRRKVFVEYVMLAGVNDSAADAKALAGILDPRSFKVNLIPYNPTRPTPQYLSVPERIFQLEIGGLPSEFAPLKTLEAGIRNLRLRARLSWGGPTSLPRSIACSTSPTAAC